jgi:hypothetical protein
MKDDSWEIKATHDKEQLRYRNYSVIVNKAFTLAWVKKSLSLTT